MVFNPVRSFLEEGSFHAGDGVREPHRGDTVTESLIT